MDALTLTPTAEQQHILHLLSSTSDNLLINALAGSGKTSTLELIQNAADEAILPSWYEPIPGTDTPVLCLAFNRRIADAMEKRFRPTTTVRTLNGLGHRIWASTCSGKLTVDPKKSSDLLRLAIAELKSKGARDDAWSIWFEILSAIGLAKSLGYIPEGTINWQKRLIDQTTLSARLEEDLDDLGWDLVDEVLALSIKASYAGSIDFNDQIYMPALFGGTYPRFPLVLVDEAQDLSPVNHEMLRHMRHSRLCVVGDPYQSIYGFRGAVQSGMAKLKTEFSMTEADLSVSFRCPSTIVRSAHWRVPHMKWIKEGGHASRLRNPSLSGFVDGSAIICRNNAPLFVLALRLLSNGRSVSVSGSDVGPRVIGIMKKLGPESLPKESLYDAIEDWRAEKLAKQSTTAGDISDCMRVFAGFGDTLGQAISYADHLFKQTGTLQLLTGHKAKGLEWPTVYHLDPWLLGEAEQELNLRYVIQTRAMETYYEILSKEIR